MTNEWWGFDNDLMSQSTKKKKAQCKRMELKETGFKY